MPQGECMTEPLSEAEGPQDLRGGEIEPMAKKAAPKAAEAKAAAADKPARVKPKTKAEVYATLAEKTGVSKKDINAVFTSLHELIVKELGKKGPGVFQIPGLLKLNVHASRR